MLIKNKPLKILFLLLLVLVFFVGNKYVFAADEKIKTLIDPYPTIGNQTIAFGMSLPALIKYIYLFAVGISGAVALTAILLGSIKYIAASGSSSKIGDAKDQIFSAILGIIILLSSYLILYTINPDLVTIGISLPPIDTSKLNSGTDVYRCICYCQIGKTSDGLGFANNVLDPNLLGSATFNKWGDKECMLKESYLAWQNCKTTCEATDDHPGLGTGCSRVNDPNLPYLEYKNSTIESASQKPSNADGCGGQ